MAPGREQSAAREEGVDSFIHIIFLTLFMQHILHSSSTVDRVFRPIGSRSGRTTMVAARTSYFLPRRFVLG